MHVCGMPGRQACTYAYADAWMHASVRACVLACTRACACHMLGGPLLLPFSEVGDFSASTTRHARHRHASCVCAHVRGHEHIGPPTNTNRKMHSKHEHIGASTRTNVRAFKDRQASSTNIQIDNKQAKLREQACEQAKQARDQASKQATQTSVRARVHGHGHWPAANILDGAEECSC